MRRRTIVVSVMPAKITSDDVIERATGLRARFSLQLEESQKISDRVQENLAQLDDLQRQIARERSHAARGTLGLKRSLVFATTPGERFRSAMVSKTWSEGPDAV